MRLTPTLSLFIRDYFRDHQISNNIGAYRDPCLRKTYNVPICITPGDGRPILMCSNMNFLTYYIDVGEDWIKDNIPQSVYQEYVKEVLNR